MERIELYSVIDEVISRHYKDGVNWSLIDESGDNHVPEQYGKTSFITKEQFSRILIRRFGCTEATVRTKWRILTIQGYILEQSRKNGYINLPYVKKMFAEYSCFDFKPNLYELDKKNTQKKHTQKNDFLEAIE